MTTSHSQPTSFPSSFSSLPDTLSADAVDTLPVLSAVLSRLQNLSTPPSTAAASPPTPSPSLLTTSSGPLTIKDIPAATDQLKHKLQRARAQVLGLPDIDRAIADQELEIRELEERIARQRAVLEDLARAGRAAVGGTITGDAMETTSG